MSIQPGTPLPWNASPAGKNMREGYSQSYAIGTWPEPKLVAGCFLDTPGGEADAETNARYIVRAANCFPELVKALEGLVSLDSDGEAGCRIDPIEYGEALNRARAALAKANEGEGA